MPRMGIDVDAKGKRNLAGYERLVPDDHVSVGLILIHFHLLIIQMLKLVNFLIIKILTHRCFYPQAFSFSFLLVIIHLSKEFRA
jgi:hypothetical protein